MRKVMPLFFLETSAALSEIGKSETAGTKAETVQALLVCHREPNTMRSCCSFFSLQMDTKAQSRPFPRLHLHSQQSLRREKKVPMFLDFYFCNGTSVLQTSLFFRIINLNTERALSPVMIYHIIFVH